jgi:16S rRNA (uracil1498-N3)-methyltransferase
MDNERYFYHSSPATGLFDEGESRHVVKVLRMAKGDRFLVTNGQGLLYAGIITDAHDKRCRFEVADEQAFTQPEPAIHLAVAPTKNADRLEWAIEKCTEIGLADLTPLICARSERRKLNTDRLISVAVSAMKQSKQVWLPRIHQPVDFTDFIASNQQGFIAHCAPDELRVPLTQAYHKAKKAVILIGPEGDFTDDEVALARKSGWEAVALGENRLRTETAAVYACIAFHISH